MNKCYKKDCDFYCLSEENNCGVYFNIKICEHNIKQNSIIQLKPITNEVFNNRNLFNKKINEEINEFKIAINNLELSKYYKNLFQDKIPHNKENIIEEFYDVIQTMLQLMIFEGLTLEQIIEGQEKHFEKLEKRGWKFNEH